MDTMHGTNATGKKRCAGTTRTGHPCTKLPIWGTPYCIYHGGAPPPGAAVPGRSQCDAKSKQNGDRCRLPAEPGRTKCRMHGGRTPRGVASPNYVHGRYSRYLPDLQLARHREILEDAQLLALREEIALVVDAIGAAQAELADPALDDRRRARLEARLDRLLELRARLNEAELKRLQVQQHLVPRAAVLVLVQQIAAVLRDELDDRTLHTVLRRMAAILRAAGYRPDADADPDPGPDPGQDHGHDAHASDTAPAPGQPPEQAPALPPPATRPSRPSRPSAQSYLD